MVSFLRTSSCWLVTRCKQVRAMYLVGLCVTNAWEIAMISARRTSGRDAKAEVPEG